MCLKVRKVKRICKHLGLVQTVRAKCPWLLSYSVFAGMVLPEGKNSLKDYYSTSKDVQDLTQTLQGCFSVFSLQPGISSWWYNFIDLLSFHFIYLYLNLLHLIDSPVTSPYIFLYIIYTAYLYIIYKEVGGLQRRWGGPHKPPNGKTRHQHCNTFPVPASRTDYRTFSFSFNWGMLVLLTGTPFLRMLSLHPAWRSWSGLVPSSTPKHTANHIHPPTPPHPHLFHYSFILPTPWLCQRYLFLLLAFPLQLALKRVKSWQLLSWLVLWAWAGLSNKLQLIS